MKVEKDRCRHCNGNIVSEDDDPFDPAFTFCLQCGRHPFTHCLSIPRDDTYDASVSSLERSFQSPSSLYRMKKFIKPDVLESREDALRQERRMSNYKHKGQVRL